MPEPEIGADDFVANVDVPIYPIVSRAMTTVEETFVRTLLALIAGDVTVRLHSPTFRSLCLALGEVDYRRRIGFTRDEALYVLEMLEMPSRTDWVTTDEGRAHLASIRTKLQREWL